MSYAVRNNQSMFVDLDDFVEVCCSCVVLLHFRGII